MNHFLQISYALKVAKKDLDAAFVTRILDLSPSSIGEVPPDANDAKREGKSMYGLVLDGWMKSGWYFNKNISGEFASCLSELMSTLRLIKGKEQALKQLVADEHAINATITARCSSAKVTGELMAAFAQQAAMIEVPVRTTISFHIFKNGGKP